MTSLRARGTGNWEARCYVGRDPRTGRPRQRSKTFPGSMSEAQARARAERWARNLRGSAGASTAALTTVGDYLEEYLEFRVSPMLSPATAKLYACYARAYVAPRIGSMPLSDLRPADVQRMYAELLRSGRRDRAPLTRATVASLDTFLNGAFRYAKAQGYIESNPMHGVAAPSPDTGESAVLGAGDVAALMDGTEGVWTIGAVAARIALATGLRRGEVCGLVWSSLRDSDASLRVSSQMVRGLFGLVRKPPKSAAGTRTVLLDGGTWRWLADWRAEQREMLLSLGSEQTGSTPVVSEDGSVASPDAIDRAWAELRDGLGLPGNATFHDLRHTHVSLLLSEGADIVTVSRRIGHSKPSVTVDRYGHMLPGSDSAAATAIGAALERGRL